jgi:TonB family protein
MRNPAAFALAFALAVLSSFPSPAIAQQTAPIRVGGAVQPPKKIKHVDPVYPAIAQTSRVEGVVILELTVAEDGTVRDVRVLRSIPLLDQAAVDAVRQWEFTPTLLNGVPQSIIYTVTVTFQLARAGGAALPSAPGRVSLFADAGAQTVFDIPVEQLASLPRWDDPTAGGPPLPSNQAADLATTWLRQRVAGASTQLNDITLRNQDAPNGRVWFYVAHYTVQAADGTRSAASAVVLLDGSVVEPHGVSR